MKPKPPARPLYGPAVLSREELAYARKFARELKTKAKARKRGGK